MEMIQNFLRSITNRAQRLVGANASGPQFAVLGLVLAASAWGLSFVVTHGAVSTYPVVDFLFLRFAVGGAALAGIGLSSPTSRKRWAGVPKRRLLWLGTVLAVAYLAQTVGLELGVSPGVAAAVTSLVVVLTPALEWALRGKTPDLRVGTGALLALVGTLLVCLTVPFGSDSGHPHVVLGMVLELVAAGAFSLQVVLVGRIGRSVPALALGAWQLLTLAAVLAVAVPFTGGPRMPSLSVLAAVVFCGLAASAFAFAVQAAAQHHVSSSVAALIMAIEPGVAMVGGAVTGIQALTPIALLGLMLLSAGALAHGSDGAVRLLRRLRAPLRWLPRPA
ncbi:MAG: DMT family transporter [Candidatus Dormiibacterota bacterium]|jgi:drug/metabolite transporter (DMT)-like permease